MQYCTKNLYGHGFKYILFCSDAVHGGAAYEQNMINYSIFWDQRHTFINDNFQKVTDIFLKKSQIFLEYCT